MQFDKLTLDKLKTLKQEGYNLLASNNKITDEQIVWFPEKIDDVCEYLIDIDFSGESSKEPTLLVIDEAIKNFTEEDLVGIVFN